MGGILTAMSLVAPSGGGGGLLSGLKACWEMTDLTDASGNGNTLTNINGTTMNAAGPGSLKSANFLRTSSQGLRINNNAYVVLGDHDQTIETWVKLTDTTGTHNLWARDGDGGVGEELRLSFGSLYFYVAHGGGTVLYIDQAYNPSAGSWYQIITEFNTTANTLRARVNDGAWDSASLSTLNAFTGPFTMGYMPYAGYEAYANANLGPTRIWDRILSSAEITSLYNGGSGLPHSSF